MPSKLAEVFVEIGGNLNPLRGVLGAARSMLGGFAGGLGLVAGGGGLAAIGVGLAKAITAGSDLNETLNKTGVIFGDQAGQVTAGAEEMAAKFGIVKTTFMDASATIGQLLIGMGGQTKSAAAATSVTLTKLAADASSIFNVSFAEATTKIAAALRGESEPISAFGIDVQEAALKQEAFRLGLVKTSRDLTMNEKVMARQALIIRGLKVAEGDLANTQHGFANSSRELGGRLTDVLATVGQALLPTIENWTAGLNQMLMSTQDWVGDNFTLISGWAETFSATVGRVAGEIGVIWRNIGLIFEAAAIPLAEWGMNINEAIQFAGRVLGAFASWVAGNWFNVIRDTFAAELAIVMNFGTNVQDLFAAIMGWFNGEGFNFEFTPLLDGFRSTIEKFPEIAGPVWADLSDQQRAIFDKMFANEKKNLDGIAEAGAKAAAKAAGRAVVGADGKIPKKEQKAEFSDVESFARKLQSGIFGDKDAVAKEQLAVNKEQLAVGKEQKAELMKVVKKMAFGVAAP